ncbi:thiamine pyrophosphate-dependent enzyme [Desulfovibrio inopinatus]|uniref:thiamine pyrophosphate-dependent enzyme n=1 Tax=Desulfovibrio inopinatus TaxID=102109 RepID=UPI00041507F7|nr:thiamine pyrophosphate-dependent enzyme [Desulfovibrio inopinatus]
MVSVDEYGEFETAWCPGCGNFQILKALKQALAGLGLKPHQVLVCSGIGQAAKTPHYLKCNAFNGLHGRSLPPATGAKLANKNLAVVVTSGDGCNYGEGGNHFLAAVRRNINITLLAHDNQIYGLTKGQASPTTLKGQKTKAQPFGAPSDAFNPVAVAVAMHAGFVARGFSGNVDHLADLIQQGIQHEGFSLIDISQPCVSFNKVNTFGWYKERCKPLPEDYDPTDWGTAMNTAMQFGETIPQGVIYKNDRPAFGSNIPAMQGEPLARRNPDLSVLAEILEEYA